MSPHEDVATIGFGDVVTLSMVGEKPADMTVTSAVMRVMSWKNRPVRESAQLNREGRETLLYADIIAIFARPDFPISN